MNSARRSRLERSLLVPLSFSLLAACGQTRGTEADTETKRAALTSADVMGFEVLNQWNVVQGSVQSLTLTDTRTQGAKALAVARPSGYTRLDSSNLPSSNMELGEIDRGASAVVDFMIPAEQANPYWFGAVQMYVSAPSRNLYNGYLGQVELTGMRTGIYTTLSFKIPNHVADALHGQTYGDLVFGVVINVPINSPGTYRLDNLRIRGKVPPRPQEDEPIQAGQSILLEPWTSYSPAANTVAESTFTQGVIQIPRSFHPVKGRAGTGSATFAYRVGTGALVTCQYPAEAAGTDYVFGSCSSGAQIGDLVPATFVRLTVVNGDAAAGKTRIKAQIALNPIGDELLAGLPPIPTFWGSNGDEIAVTFEAYLRQQLNWQPSGFVQVKLPTPHIAPRDSVTRNGTALPPARPPEDNDPPFGVDGRMTHDTRADAGWHVRGSIAAPIDAAGNRRTEFRLDAGVEVWMLNQHTDFLKIIGNVDTNTPRPSGGTVPPSTHSADFCFEFFGHDALCAGPFNAQTGLNQPLININPEVTLISFPSFPFFVDASVLLTLRANLTGSFTPTGFAIGIDPLARVRGKLRGGIGVPGFLAGGLSLTADLLRIDAPITASVNATLDLTPGSCKIHLTETLQGEAIISMGAGSINWWTEAGLCCGCDIGEICWRESGRIYDWGPLAERHIEILPATPLANHDIPLDVATICPPIQDAPGDVDYPISGQTFKQGDRSFMAAQFTIAIPDDSQPSGVRLIPLDNLTWTSSNPSDVIAGNMIRYGAPGTRLLSVVATKPGVGTGTGSVSVNVVANDPAVAPDLTILTPAPGLTFDCVVVNASAAGFDPNGGVLTTSWYATNPGTLDPYSQRGTFLGDGANISFGSDPATGDQTILRAVVIDPQGNVSLAEIPIRLTCVT
jgi:hypothetical protein